MVFVQVTLSQRYWPSGCPGTPERRRFRSAHTSADRLTLRIAHTHTYIPTPPPPPKKNMNFLVELLLCLFVFLWINVNRSFLNSFVCRVVFSPAFIFMLAATARLKSGYPLCGRFVFFLLAFWSFILIMDVFLELRARPPIVRYQR